MHIHKCIDMYTYISIHINKRRHIFVNTHTHLKTCINTGCDEAHECISSADTNKLKCAHAHLYTHTGCAARLRGGRSGTCMSACPTVDLNDG